MGNGFAMGQTWQYECEKKRPNWAFVCWNWKVFFLPALVALHLFVYRICRLNGKCLPWFCCCFCWLEPLGAHMARLIYLYQIGNNKFSKCTPFITYTKFTINVPSLSKNKFRITAPLDNIFCSVRTFFISVLVMVLLYDISLSSPSRDTNPVYAQRVCTKIQSRSQVQCRCRQIVCWQPFFASFLLQGGEKKMGMFHVI